jgi:hypothetical protein
MTLAQFPSDQHGKASHTVQHDSLGEIKRKSSKEHRDQFNKE